MLLENIGHEKNIDFIYCAYANDLHIRPTEGESNKFHWLTKDDIKRNESIKPNIKEMALKALNLSDNIL